MTGVLATFLVPQDRTPDGNGLREEELLMLTFFFGGGDTAHHSREGTMSRVVLPIIAETRGGHFSHLSEPGGRKKDRKQSQVRTSQSRPPAGPLVSKVQHQGTMCSDT